MTVRSLFLKTVSIAALSFVASIPFSAKTYAFDFGFLPFKGDSQALSVIVHGNNYLFLASDKDNALGEGAQHFVENMGQRALSFLADEDITKEKKAKEFKDLLEDSFDMNTIARFALGRHWRVASNEQKKEYMGLFKTMIVKVYSSRFDEYQGQSFEVRHTRAESDKDAIVTSFIVPESGSEIQIDWRVRYKKGRYKVIDVIVEGVSMSVTQRSDFSSVIQRGGGDVEVLLDHLRTKAG